MTALVVVYVVIAGFSVYEEHYLRAWYWLAAAQITFCVGLMK